MQEEVMKEVRFLGVGYRTKDMRNHDVLSRHLNTLDKFLARIDDAASKKGLEYYTYFKSGDELLSRFMVKRNHSKVNNVLGLFDMEPCNKDLKYLPKFIYFIDKGYVAFYPKYRIGEESYALCGGEPGDDIDLSVLRDSSMRIFDEITKEIDESLIKGKDETEVNELV